MPKYRYTGPVMQFSVCVENNWTGITVAVSEKKAKSNLAYQWKKLRRRVKDAKITLPGKLEVI